MPKHTGTFWPALVVTGYTSINACVKAELFPTGIRALGVALPYAVANALFGGTAEYIALWFKDAGAESGYFWYVAGCAAVSLVVYLSMRETRDLDLYRIGGAGEPAAPAPGRPSGETSVTTAF